MADVLELRAELAKLNKERDKRNAADRKAAKKLTDAIDRAVAEAVAESKVGGMSEAEKAAMRAALGGDV